MTAASINRACLVLQPYREAKAAETSTLELCLLPSSHQSLLIHFLEGSLTQGYGSFSRDEFSDHPLWRMNDGFSGWEKNLLPEGWDDFFFFKLKDFNFLVNCS